MSELVTPLSTGIINGSSVRFFKAPLPEPHLPWHAAADLQRALKLPRDLRRHLLRMTQESWPGALRTVATADGLVTIAPHYLAQGIIGAAIEKGYVPTSIEFEYTRAGAAAMEALGEGLPPIAQFELAMIAAKNTLGVDRKETPDA